MAEAIGGVLSISIPPTALQCVIPELTFYDRFYFVMLLPASSIAIALLSYLYQSTCGFRPWKRWRLSPMEVARTQALLCTRGRRFYQVCRGQQLGCCAVCIVCCFCMCVCVCVCVCVCAAKNAPPPPPAARAACAS